MMHAEAVDSVAIEALHHHRDPFKDCLRSPWPLHHRPHMIISDWPFSLSLGNSIQFADVLLQGLGSVTCQIATRGSELLLNER